METDTPPPTPVVLKGSKIYPAKVDLKRNKPGGVVKTK